MTAADWPDVQRVYAEGIATGRATFESAPPAAWEDFIRTKVAPCALTARDESGPLAGQWCDTLLLERRSPVAGLG